MLTILICKNIKIGLPIIGDKNPAKLSIDTNLLTINKFGRNRVNIFYFCVTRNLQIRINCRVYIKNID